LTQKSQPRPHFSEGQGIPAKSFFDDQQRRAEGYMDRYRSLNAYERHKKLINEYMLYYPGSTSRLKRDTSKDKVDLDIVRENHRFIWTDSEDPNTWEKQLSKKYYDKLFREYGLYDLSRYKENKIAIRWRVEKEVVDGKGQFSCGEIHCSNLDGLRSWEVNFAYMEEGTKKNALVKLRACPGCSIKLNHSQMRKEVTKKSSKRSKSRDKNKSKRKSVPSAAAGSEISSQSSSSSSDHTNVSEDIWKDPLVLPELKSREEEYDNYLEDLFL